MTAAMAVLVPDEGRTLTQRPIRPDDVERLERMFGRLSEQTVYRRFLTPIPKVRPWALRHLATVDHLDRDAVVALHGDEIVGVARYDRPRDGDGTTAEVAVLVEDAWQHHGVARWLLRTLAKTARQRGIGELTATVLAENVPALRLARTLNPRATMQGTGVERELVLPLG